MPGSALFLLWGILLRKTIVAAVSFLVGAIGFGSGCVTVYQFLLEPARIEARQEGKEEIAAEVLRQLAAAGFDTSNAKAALAEGQIDDAIAQATQAVLAPPVATAPSQPFQLEEGDVIDLASGAMLSFRVVSIGGDDAEIRLKVDDETSIDLDTGDSMVLNDGSGCRIDYLSI